MRASAHHGMLVVVTHMLVPACVFAQKRGLPPYIPPVTSADDVQNFDTYSHSVDDAAGAGGGGFGRRRKPGGRPPSIGDDEPPEFTHADFASL